MSTNYRMVAVIVLLAGLLVGLVVPATGVSGSRPEAVVKAFWAAAAKGDKATAVKYCDEPPEFAKNKAAWKKLQKVARAFVGVRGPYRIKNIVIVGALFDAKKLGWLPKDLQLVLGAYKNALRGATDRDRQRAYIDFISELKKGRMVHPLGMTLKRGRWLVMFEASQPKPFVEEVK